LKRATADRVFNQDDRSREKNEGQDKRQNQTGEHHPPEVDDRFDVAKHLRTEADKAMFSAKTTGKDRVNANVG